MNSNRYRITLWASVVGALVLVVGGLIWLAQGGGRAEVYVPAVNEIMADDNVAGKADASVTVVEYSDFQCPACAQYHAIVKELVKNYGDRVRFVHRNFPIPGYVNGLAAARAAEAAALQGKFFEMADMVFTRQREWTSQDSSAFAKTLDSYAQAIGLDIDRFRADKESQAVLDKIRRDTDSALDAGVDSTPSFFINGTRIQHGSYADFAGKLDKALAQ
jgi:protein-disulfide isomerase